MHRFRQQFGRARLRTRQNLYRPRHRLEERHYRRARTMRAARPRRPREKICATSGIAPAKRMRAPTPSRIASRPCHRLFGSAPTTSRCAPRATFGHAAMRNRSPLRPNPLPTNATIGAPSVRTSEKGNVRACLVVARRRETLHRSTPLYRVMTFCTRRWNSRISCWRTTLETAMAGLQMRRGKAAALDEDLRAMVR